MTNTTKDETTDRTDWSRPVCCLITHPTFGSCCCLCKYRLRLLRVDKWTKNIHQNGWVCIAFAFMEGEDTAYEATEHGMCELFTSGKG